MAPLRIWEKKVKMSRRRKTIWRTKHDWNFKIPSEDEIKSAFIVCFFKENKWLKLQFQDLEVKLFESSMTGGTGGACMDFDNTPLPTNKNVNRNLFDDTPLPAQVLGMTHKFFLLGSESLRS